MAFAQDIRKDTMEVLVARLQTETGQLAQLLSAYNFDASIEVCQNITAITSRIAQRCDLVTGRP